MPTATATSSLAKANSLSSKMVGPTRSARSVACELPTELRSFELSLFFYQYQVTTYPSVRRFFWGGGLQIWFLAFSELGSGNEWYIIPRGLVNGY